MGLCCTAGWKYRWIVNTEDDARNAANIFNSCNYIGNNLASPDVGTLNTALGNLASDSHIIFLSGHGNSHGISAWANGAEYKIRLRTSPVPGEADMSGILTSQTECVVYAGCRTANGSNSIAERSVRPGRAQNAIGWVEKVSNGPHKSWLSRFLHAWSIYQDWEDAIDEANIGCCTCWFTGVKSARLFKGAGNDVGQVLSDVSRQKDTRLVWEGDGKEYPLTKEEPDQVLTYLQKLNLDLSGRQWKVLVSDQGDSDFCLDVVQMQDDVYTSSSYTVFVKGGYMKAVYDAQFQMPENPCLKTALEEDDINKELEKAREAVKENGGTIQGEKWYHFYDVEEDKPSVIILIEYQTDDPDEEMRYTDLYMSQAF